MTTRIDPEIELQVIRNLEGRWSVFEMTIMLHHYSSRAPFDRADAPIYDDCVSRLQGHGLLDENKLPTLRGALFVGMLLNAPVPKDTPRRELKGKLDELTASDDPCDVWRWLCLMEGTK